MILAAKCAVVNEGAAARGTAVRKQCIARVFCLGATTLSKMSFGPMSTKTAPPAHMASSGLD
jgi:hypothetical protein